MKITLSLFLLLSAISSARAANIGPIGVFVSSMTARVVSVSSTTPTIMDSTQTVAAMYDRTFAALQTLSPSSVTVCGFQSDLTCSANSFVLPITSTLTGELVNIPIPAVKSWSIFDRQKTFNIWCLSCAVDAKTSVAIIQGK